MQIRPLVLVTGATGYIGGRLIPRLISEGYPVRCLVRDPQRIQGRAWEHLVEIVIGDALNPQDLSRAFQGVKAAYYLIHSMRAGTNFNERDLQAALNFGSSARQAGIDRIIYLGGLGDPGTLLSHHLRSRQSTGEALRRAGVPVIEFRAAMVVGSGSLSFEMMRYLTERLPIIPCPRLVDTLTQPIAISDVLAFLVAALDLSLSSDQIVEIGGADILSYRQMMLTYAHLRGLKRILIPVPVPRSLLFSNWIFYDTPVPAAIARPLIDSLQNENIVRSEAVRRLFPAIRPMSYQDAVQEALQQLDAGKVETTWRDALITSQDGVPARIMENHEGMVLENRKRLVDAPPSHVFQTFSSLGGSRGWLYWNWAWQIRGIVDLILGGVGLRRGRRNPTEVRVGDAIDFWRVEAVEPGCLLRLRAEMKLPGKAWLQFHVHAQDHGKSLLQQTAYFAPKGLFGFLYWYLLYPVHRLIFSGMIRKIAEQAARLGSQVE